MPINATTEIEFFNQLRTQGRLSLDAVYDIFYKAKKSRNPKNLGIFLHTHCGDGEDGELILVEKSTDKPVYIEVAGVLDQPEGYDVLYNGCEQSELAKLGYFSDRLVNESELIDWLKVDRVLRDQVAVHGDIELAPAVMHRLEGFAYYVANLIVQRRYDDLSGLYWDSSKEENTPDGLAAYFSSTESKHGKIELFNNVWVSRVYAGIEGAKKHFDEMKLPKGVKRNQRVGVANFNLASSITGNGISRWVLDVYFEAIQNDKGEIKITNMNVMYTY